MSLHIAIYGAATDIPPQLARPLPWLPGLKRSLKARRDVRRFMRTGEFLCDYRDYTVDHVSNIGDIAIAETIRHHLRQVNPDCAFSNINWGHVSRLEEAHARRSLDLLVVAGGGYFLFNHDGQLPARIHSDHAFCKDKGIPLVFWGIGVNQPFNPNSSTCPPSPSAEDEASLHGLLDAAALITVRDEYSARFLASYTDQTIHLVGDPALHASTVLGLTPAPENLADGPLIGLNFAFHGPSSNKFLRANLKAYVRALQAIQEQSQCRFRYIVHHACEYVVPRLLRAAGIKLEIVHAGLAATCNAYRDLDLHIGGMLHSCILAASAGTPWIAIAYDIKHQGFNQLMGMEDFYQDTRNFSEEKLTALALHALEKRSQLREHISTRRRELQHYSTDITNTALVRPN